MGNLQSFQDMTGSMKQADVNTQDITNIIQELNRTSDQLDALNNTLSISGYGSLTYNWLGGGTGASPVQDTLTSPFNSPGNYIGLSYMTRATENNKLFHALPFSELGVNANGDSVITKYFLSGVDTNTGKYTVVVTFPQSGTPEIFTFYYLVFVQPTGLAAH